MTLDELKNELRRLNYPSIYHYANYYTIARIDCGPWTEEFLYTLEHRCGRKDGSTGKEILLDENFAIACEDFAIEFLKEKMPKFTAIWNNNDEILRHYMCVNTV